METVTATENVVWSAMEDESSAMIVMIAEYRLRPGRRDAFVEIMRGYARETLEEIEGCEQFDVLLSQDDEERALVYEVFRDEASYRAYTGSNRVPRVREAYKDMVVDRRITKCVRVQAGARTGRT